MSTIPYRTFACMLCLVLGASTIVSGAESNGAGQRDSTVAEINGQPIMMSELEEWGSARLRELERERHTALESSLGQLVEQRLLELEAKRREIAVAELLEAEVEGKVQVVTEAEVDAFYTQNQARMRRPKEDVADQIRIHLQQQRTGPVRVEFVDSLRSRFGVAIHLEPLRLALDSSAAPFKGPRDAAVTVRLHSDFQCPYCARLLPAWSQLEESYSDRVRFAFLQLPLRSIHPHAQKAAEASLCAEAQGKFWPMHDAMFARQKELAVADLKQRAQEVGLDRKTFDTCLDGGAMAEAVQRDVDAAQSIGLTGTPVVFVNGRSVPLLRGADPFDLVSAVIEDELETGPVR